MQMTNIFMSPKTSLMVSPSSVRKLGFATENSQSKLKLPAIRLKNSNATIQTHRAEPKKRFSIQEVQRPNLRATFNSTLIS